MQIYYPNYIAIHHFLCNKKYFRPAEVDSLIGDARKAKRVLKWKPKINIHELIKEMIDFENPN